MDARNSDPSARASVNIFDGAAFPRGEEFDAFHATLQSSPMKWSPIKTAEEDFEFRTDSVVVGDGGVSVSVAAPHISAITASDISQSSMEGYFFGQSFLGNLIFDQAGRSNLIEPGDLIVYDSAQPLQVSYPEPTRAHTVCIFVPKDAFKSIKNAHTSFLNWRVDRQSMRVPLAQCLTMLGRRMHNLTNAEIVGLHDACVSLLPVALGCYGQSTSELSIVPVSDLHREILFHIDNRIADATLSPLSVAKVFGISDRYVHKMFALAGTTMSTYVKKQRLRFAGRDLACTSHRHHPIATIASRWGFGDLSVFHRSFKEQYGCTPREYRMRYR